MTHPTEQELPPHVSIAPSKIGVSGWVFVAGVSLLMACGAPEGLPPEMSTSERLVTTQHQIWLDGQPLPYTARAGLLPILDNRAGEARAHIYFMSYTVDRREGEPPRPILFLWNGGPGMNSSLIHLLGFGPRRIRTGDEFPSSPPPSETQMEDNQETWLNWADLVFVDPVGTGFSRPTRAEYGTDFYQTPGDAEAISEFIRVYTTRFDTWDQPLFIVGHSYGTTRAMWMSDVLVRRRIDLKGVALLSGGFQVGQDSLPPGYSVALAVPGMTAAAFYHGTLAPELQDDFEITMEEARRWAQNDYAPALARRDELSALERNAVREGLARYSGMAVELIDASTLTVERDQFRAELMSNTVLGRYDARMAREGRPADPRVDLELDPSFEPALKLIQGRSPLLNRYIRHELGFESDLLYQGPLGWEYPRVERIPTQREASTANDMFVQGQDHGLDPSGQPLPPPLRRAMDAKPALRVFVARGLYDSGSCFRHLYEVERLEPSLARRVFVACYEAGHDFYTDRAVRRAIKRDMTLFVDETLAGWVEPP